MRIGYVRNAVRERDGRETNVEAKRQETSARGEGES